MFKTPSLISVKDVPFDQGGKVELIWGASSLETDINSMPYYSIWRAYPQSSQKISLGNPKSITENKKTRLMKIASGTYIWEWLANPACT